MCSSNMARAVSCQKTRIWSPPWKGPMPLYHAGQRTIGTTQARVCTRRRWSLHFNRAMQWDEDGKRIFECRFARRNFAWISSMRKSNVLTTSFGRRRLRKQFCAFLADPRFRTASRGSGHGFAGG